MPKPPYDDCVFLNVPFDPKYEPFLRALVFTVHDCGFVARCAREIDNSGQIRLEKIYELMGESRYGIHDISRTSLDRANRLPRFNMPLELGIFLGATKFGTGRQKTKSCLILDREPHRYQKYCSDIAGQDIRAHHDSVHEAVKTVRNWLSGHLISRNIQVPGHTKVNERFERFGRELPAICSGLQLAAKDLIFNEYTALVVGWLRANPWTT
ncbi:MAG TPA: hypothetical protein VMW27_05070 [Thermoanaerobaculia bacterium]|nr:hypothetical protein [Thermoanaerobaculia bacterium]